MALNIKDPETDRLARELVKRTGESITVATRTALAERLERVEATAQPGEIYRKLMEIGARGRARPILDSRSEDEILGYNEFGVPE